MPTGGMTSAGSGLRLQATTPGLTDTGNANISGVMIAGRMSTSTANIGSQAELFGHNIKFAAAEPTNSLGVGNDIEFSNAATNLTAVGFQATCTSPGGVAIGSTVQAGAVPSTGFANMIAVGKDVSVGANAASVGNSVGMGYQISVGPSKGVAFGSSVTLNNANGATSASVAFGIAIGVGAAATRNVLLGNNISPASRSNVTVIGDYQVGGYPVAGPGQEDNSILIGNTLQTKVQLGPYTITNGIAAVGFLGTANVTVANTVVETSILGAGVGTLVIPAGRLSVGSTIRLKVRGIIADTLTPTLQIRAKLNGTTFIDTGATALTALAGGTHGWSYEAEITVRTTGAGGTAIGNHSMVISSTAAPDLDSTNTGTTAIDTTAAQTLNLTVQWGTANVANTLTQTNITMEILG